ncbi:MAG: alpha/beta fold hydrolase [Pseudolabrys sp.]
MAQLDIPGASIRYELSGEGGDWLVLLHEIGGTLESWSAAVPALEKRFRVLRYDQRGAGGSSKIEGAFSIDTLAGDIPAILSALGHRGACHFAGVAMGCALAVRHAARNPDQVKSLMLACPALSVSADRVQYLSQRAAQVEREGMGATVDTTLGNSYPPEVVRDRAVYDAYRARFLANDPASYAAINRAFATFDATPDLPRLRCPTLVLAGAHDRLRPPSYVRDIAARVPGAQFRELDSGHVMPVQAPDAMAAAMAAFHAANR